jgi:hypothetical protein
LSLVSFDRFMIVYSRKWVLKITNKPHRFDILIGSIIVLIFLANSHLLFLNGYTVTNLNVTNHQNISNSIETPTEVVCYKSRNDPHYIYPKWQRYHIFIYNFIPFGIMLFCNTMLIYNLKFKTKKVKSSTSSSRQRIQRITTTLIIVTFSFIILTLPRYNKHNNKNFYFNLVNLFIIIIQVC